MGTPSHPSHIGRYQIQRLIGAGGMGDVYLATDPHIERHLAIKTVRLRGAPAEVEDHKQRLLREAKATGRLVHPHVVTLFDAGEADGLLYLAFEFVDGPDLGRRMKSRPPLSLGHSLNLVKQIAEGLDFAHVQGIIHRDIKPSNILLDPRGHAKIADFGLAKMNDESMELTRTGSVVGSPQYMSPEQVRGETLDGRTDIFSLGVLLYELMTSLRPFGGQTISTLVFEILSKEPPPLGQLRPDLPAGIVDLVRNMLAKDPRSRVANAGEIVHQLDEVLATTPMPVLEAPAYVPIDASAPTELLARTPTPGAVAAPATPAPVSGPPLSGSPSASFAETAASSRAASPPPPPVPTLPMSTPGFAGPPPPPVAAPAPAAGSASSPLPSAGASAAASTSKSTRWVLWGFVACLLLLLVAAGGWGLMRWLQRAEPSPVTTVAEASLPGAAGSLPGTEDSPPDKPGTEAATPQTVPPDDDGARSGTAPSGDAAPAVRERSPGATPGASAVPPPSSTSTTAAQTPPSQDRTPIATTQRSPPPQPSSSPPTSRAPTNAPGTGASGTGASGTGASGATPTGTAPGDSRPDLEPLAVASHIAAFEAAAEGAHREMDSGRFFKFLIEPPDAVVRLWQRGEERQVVLGQARQYNARDRDSRSVELPDDGDFLFTFLGEGHPDLVVLVHATSGRGAGPQVIRARLGAENRERGGPRRLQVSRSLAFDGSPADATVYVDGVAKGPADQWPGGLRAGGPRNLQMTPGRHRVRIQAAGYEPFEILVEVSPAGPRAATVTYDLKRQP